MLAPLSFFSAFDPPVLPPYPRLARADKLAGMGRVIKRLARFTTRKWPEPIFELRHHLGLAPGPNPLFDAKHSPNLVLALFSRVLGVEQRDWPANTLIAGFCFYDADAGNAALPPHLEKFVSSGEPPVVFTLGSAAVLAAGNFYEVSAKVAMTLGLRAVLLVGSDPANKPKQKLPTSICVAEYAPYSALFSRSSLIVHQGGVGTTAQCLRAGKPMLIMPYSHDQPDNARRMRRLGVSRTIQKASYTPARAARALRAVLDQPLYAERARIIAEHVCRENGIKTACDALEELYRKEQTLAVRSSMSERMPLSQPGILPGRETKIFDPHDPACGTHGAELLDATVVKRGNQWWMYLAGQAHCVGAPLLYSASLPAGAPLSATGWNVTLDTNGEVVPLAGQQASAKWDSAGGRHCPCHVKGIDPHSGKPVERIYYAGAAENIWGPYTIGYLEWNGDRGSIRSSLPSSRIRSGNAAASMSPTWFTTKASGRCGTSPALTSMTISFMATPRAPTGAPTGASIRSSLRLR